ncbi:MAG: 6-carboxytetrahydropterin synthase QueD [bacterium]
MAFEISTEATFSAAHFIAGYAGDCSRLHGHNWVVRVFVRSEKRSESGITCDFRGLRHLLEDVVSPLDHSVLNEVEGFGNLNPTAETLAEWIYERLKSRLEPDIRLARVEVWESPKNFAAYLDE